jgi:hypothetical protein
MSDEVREQDRDNEVDVTALTLDQRKLGVMSEVVTLEKQNEAFFGAFVSHDQVAQFIRPLLVKWRIGLGVSMELLEINPAWIRLTVTLTNVDNMGDDEQSTWVIPYPEKMGSQGAGAALSYLKKYAMSQIFMLDSGDDDLDNHGDTSGNQGAAGAQPGAGKGMPFGKYAGKAWPEIPTDYLEWVVDKSEMSTKNVDLWNAAKSELESRIDGEGGSYPGGEAPDFPDIPQ